MRAASAASRTARPACGPAGPWWEHRPPPLPPGPPTGRADPEPHDLEDLGLDVRVRRVEVRLEVVEAVEVPRARFLVVGPGRLLHAREHHAGVRVGRLLVRPDVPVAVA